ncbi:MAG: DsrE family protein [Acidimicrobiales bacterium]
MSTDKTIIFLSRGIDDERATVAWTLANGGVQNGQDVTVFCVSSGVDLVRKGAADTVQMNPHDPSMKDLIDNFMAAGGVVWACPPCSSLRGYTEDNFIDGVKITGAGPVYELIGQGAATICL